MTNLSTTVRPLIFINLFATFGLIGCQTLTDAPAISASPNAQENKLIFESIIKAIEPAANLPITNELLEQFQWRLVSAVSNTYNDDGQLIRKPIGNFYHPDYPISTRFESWHDNQYVFFSSYCNNSRMPYFLLNDNTFKVSTIISTMMGCGETGNRIETALFGLMQNSSSQLTLSMQPSQPVSISSASQTDMPRYNLLQTMDTGETLVWQNEPLSKLAP